MKKIVVPMLMMVILTLSATVFAEMPNEEYVEVTGYGEPGQTFSKGIRAA